MPCDVGFRNQLVTELKLDPGLQTRTYHSILVRKFMYLSLHVIPGTIAILDGIHFNDVSYCAVCNGPVFKTYSVGMDFRCHPGHGSEAMGGRRPNIFYVAWQDQKEGILFMKIQLTTRVYSK